MPGFNRLHNRIMLPFIVLFLVIGLVALLLNRYYIGKLIDRRIAVQTDRITRLISNSEFVLNPGYLAKLRNVIDSDIIVFGSDGKVTASTIQNQVRAHLESQIPPGRISAILKKENESLFQDVVLIDKRSYMLTGRLIGRARDMDKKSMLWVISPMFDAQAAKSSLTIRMGLVCLGGILITFVFGHLIARSVTTPVGNLVTVTRKVADGHFDHKALLPSVAELRQLASSINMMSTKLAGFEKQVAQSSRLAAAGKVTAAMSHEIRNPLSSIKMLAQLLRDRPAMTPEDRKIVQSILEEILRVERIVEDLSGLARPSRLVRQYQDMRTVIHEILTIIKPKLAHRKIDLEFDCQPGMPQVLMDKDRIKQVLWNLLLNAMESMPRGGRIKIAARVNGERRRLQIGVEDEGCGFDDAHAEEMFTPFYTTKPEGLGLGLSTSKEIMAGHGGELILEKRRRKGARAIMTLPLST
jgi:signal transduction histidine kinase